jgi:uncharacterized protein Veg
MEKTRNFEEDLRNSNNPNLRKAWERIFKLKFGEDCEIDWKDNKNIQKELGTDITIKTKKGRRYSVELKTRQKCYEPELYIMEIISHIYDQEQEPRTYLHSKEGWIYTTTAEYIFHATIENNQIIDCIFYSLVPFKLEKYKSEFNNYKNFWLPTLFSNGNFQLTLNKLIPKEIIKRDSLEFWGWKYGIKN